MTTELKNNTILKFLLLLIFITNSVVAQLPKATIKATLGKGVQFTSADSLFTLAISGRVQSLYEAKHIINNNTTGADFILRRCRLNLQGNALHTKISYRVQLSFALNDINAGNSKVQNNLILRDAMLFYTLNNKLRLGFGQTKLPGNRQRQVSSGSLQLVERSIVNSNFTLDRDKGVWLFYNTKINKTIFKTTLAVSSGEGRIISNKNGKLCYTSRIEILPFGNFTNNGDYVEAAVEPQNKPKLAVAAVFSKNYNATRTMGQLGEYLFNDTTANITYFGGDVLFKFKGFSIAAELYKRNANTGIFTNTTNTTQKNFVIAGTGLLLQTGYMLTPKNEIAARYAQILPSSNLTPLIKKQQEFTLGFSHYFNNHNLKIQTEISKFINGINKMLVLRVSGVVSF